MPLPTIRNQQVASSILAGGSIILKGFQETRSSTGGNFGASIPRAGPARRPIARRHVVTPATNPKAWINALPDNLGGTHLPAEMVDGAQHYLCRALKSSTQQKPRTNVGCEGGFQTVPSASTRRGGFRNCRVFATI